MFEIGRQLPLQAPVFEGDIDNTGIVSCEQVALRTLLSVSPSVTTLSQS